MKANLSSLIAGATTELRKSKCDLARHYAFGLEELRRHLEELARGEHTIAQFAECYCIPITVDRSVSANPNADLIAALEFYADRNKYHDQESHDLDSSIGIDRGDRARAALTKARGE